MLSNKKNLSSITRQLTIAVILITLITSSLMLKIYFENKKEHLLTKTHSESKIYHFYKLSEDNIFEMLVSDSIFSFLNKIDDNGNSSFDIEGMDNLYTEWLNNLNRDIVKYNNILFSDISGNILYSVRRSPKKVYNIPDNIRNAELNETVYFTTITNSFDNVFYNANAVRRFELPNGQEYYVMLTLNNTYVSNLLNDNTFGDDSTSHLVNIPNNSYYSEGAIDDDFVTGSFIIDKLKQEINSQKHNLSTVSIFVTRFNNTFYYCSFVYIDIINSYYLLTTPIFDLGDPTLITLMTVLLSLLVLSLLSIYYIKKTVLIKPLTNLLQLLKIDSLSDFEDKDLENEILSTITNTFDEVKDLKNKNSILTDYDTITGLLNFNGLSKAYEKYVDTNKPFGVILFSINNLDNINNFFSMDIGDMTLLKTAIIMNDCSDCSVGRISSSRFLLIGTGSSESLKDRTNHLFEAFSKYINVGFVEVQLDFDLTYIEYNDNPLPFKVTIANLKSGRDFNNNLSGRPFRISKSLHDEMRRKVKLDTMVSKITKNNDFYLLFQPEINLKTDKICGFESLLRLNNNELGFLSPEEFLPTLEKNGDIISLGYKILENACHFIKRLLYNDFDFDFVSVNVSAVQLREPEFLNNILAILDSHNIPCKYLQLELTESLLVDNIKQTIIILQGFRDNGISIALDDFGTKFSSFNYLVELPIDVLKIDRSFIYNLLQENKKKVVVNFIIDMCIELNLKSVIEGVETKEVKDYFVKAGCDIMQGYYFSRPIQADEAIALFVKTNL